ncbi:hypothetical protein ABK040_003078 [Willaertia magna]
MPSKKITTNSHASSIQNVLNSGNANNSSFNGYGSNLNNMNSNNNPLNWSDYISDQIIHHTSRSALIPSSSSSTTMNATIGTSYNASNYSLNNNHIVGSSSSFTEQLKDEEENTEIALMSPSSSKNDSPQHFNQLNQQIEQIVKCFICLSKPTSPHLCPCCSKIVCLACIKKWLIEQGKTICPHCRSTLTMNRLVNCRFISEISSEIEKIQTQIKKDKSEKVKSNLLATNSSGALNLQNSNEQCTTHSLPLIYFCETCKEPICSDCAMFEEKHKYHRFKKLSEVYKENVEIVKKESEGLKNRLNELNVLVGSIDENIKRITKSKDERMKEIVDVLEETKENLDTQFKDKLLTLLEQQTSITEEISLLDKMSKELTRQIETSPQSVLISKTPEIVKMLSEVHKKPTTHFSRLLTVPDSFPSEIVPNYDQSTFVIENYLKLRKTTDVIYSPPMIINGLYWRLKVYPNGTGMARGTFISVFLEMWKGMTDAKKYHYKVKMVNRKDESKSIERAFASVFEIGECWGYNRFYRISELITNGFVDPNEDILTLNFFVRPATYFDKCQEQCKYIKSLEESRRTLLKYNEALRKSLNLPLGEMDSSEGNGEEELIEMYKEIMLEENPEEQTTEGHEEKDRESGKESYTEDGVVLIEEKNESKEAPITASIWSSNEEDNVKQIDNESSTSSSVEIEELMISPINPSLLSEEDEKEEINIPTIEDEKQSINMNEYYEDGFVTAVNSNKNTNTTENGYDFFSD